MSKNPLQPKTEFEGRALSIPQQGLYRAMRGFLADLEKAEQEYCDEVAAIRKNLQIAADYQETPDVARYSLAVQVFAAMTIDAVISFYAVLRFGGENEEEFRWNSADKRLKKALDGVSISLDDNAELFSVVRDVMQARNRIVHPFSAEYSGTEQATLKLPHRPESDASASAAREAVKRVDRFLLLMQKLDKEHGYLLAQF